jgi:hypothetical protein
MNAGPSIADIAGMLARQAPSLVAELLPNGRREGAEWRVGSLAGEPGRSLAVRLFGSRAGVWADFAAGEAGDALDLVAGVLYRGDKRAALAWARSWLGLGDAGAPPPRHLPSPAAVVDPGTDPEAEGKRRTALRIFLAAAPHLAGTPAAAYLAARGIDLAELGRQPRSLRFAPHLPNRESASTWPALVAAVTNAAGQHVATHRTWLQRDPDGIWRKAKLANPKMSLGGVAGGSIRIWRGASGKPLAQAPEGETVAIAEGIETALSVAIACPELRVLSAVSLGNMGRLAPPPAVRTVILCADNDGPNEGAARALQRAVDHYATGGRIVKIAVPPCGKDFNDTLQQVDA